MLGYLVAQFPKQTDTYFWREIRALREMGVELDIVSTQFPTAGTVCHTWSEEARSQTYYLTPFGVGGLLRAIKQIGRGGPVVWGRLARHIALPDGGGMKLRFRLIGLCLVGSILADRARALGYRHIHVHTCADAAHVALFCHLISGVPYSITQHNDLPQYGPNQYNKWKHVAFGVFITEGNRDEARATLRDAMPDRFEVVPMGVETDRFKRSAPYQPWEPGQRLRLLAVGRLNEGKGYYYLLQAMQMLQEDGVDFHLRVVGEDRQGGTGYRKVVEAEIAERGLSDRVTLLGAISEDQVIEEMDRAHMLVHASLSEAMPVSLMEAMSMSLPVVATSVAGTPVLIHTGDHGLLVPPKEPRQLAASVKRLMDDPVLTLRIVNAARDRVVESFSTHRSAQTLVRLAGLNGACGAVV